MSEKLKPCPFCGETRFEYIISQGMNGRYFIKHYDDVYHIQSSIGFETEREAIEAWNRRTENND